MCNVMNTLQTPAGSNLLIYEITVEVRADLTVAYESYMRGKHIPDLIATGFFSEVRFLRSANRYRIQYLTADLDGYLARDADRLRADFLAHFPDGVSVQRENWEVVEVWDDIPL